MSDTDTGDRLFTQEDLDRIVRERLAKEKAKTETTLAAERAELERRAFLLEAREAVAMAGLPASFADALDKSSPEAFERALDIAVQSFGKKPAMPSRGGFSGGQGNTTGPDPDPIREGFGLNRKDE